MTINGIWTWASNYSKQCAIESLRGKTLAIDGHIWLYECFQGASSHHRSGASYLVTIFKRCQRLLEQNIRPVVVFDSIISKQSTTSEANNICPRKRRSGDGTVFTDMADKVMKCQIMLKHLGVSVIVTSGDGEAQCAQLELAGIVHGTISTDFDYFLFGGRNLYRINFENAASSIKDVCHLDMETMKKELYLSRNSLISLAILLGCDYYFNGVQGVGVATGIDIMNEFQHDFNDEEDDPIVILDRFSSYVRAEIPERIEDSQRKLRLRRKKYHLLDDFPNSDSVREAVNIYMNPNVIQQFQLKPPSDIDTAKVERILMDECGFSVEKTKQELKLTEKRVGSLKEKAKQTKIPDYFTLSKKKYGPVVKECSINEYIQNNRKWIVEKKKRCWTKEEVEDGSYEKEKKPRGSRRMRKIQTHDDNYEHVEVIQLD